ncbi:hypothetical protein ACWD3Z_17255 [Streptomyces sp. NPDC002740]
MRRPLSLAAVLACVLLAGGCVSVPSSAPPPTPRMEAAAARTPSPLPPAAQPSARTALVTTAPVRKTAKRHADRPVTTRRRSTGSAGHERPRVPAPQQPHRAVRPAPARPAGPGARRHGAAPAAPRHRPARPRTARPQSTYDLRTVCGWAHRAPVPSGAASLCDSYVR